MRWKSKLNNLENVSNIFILNYSKMHKKLLTFQIWSIIILWQNNDTLLLFFLSCNAVKTGQIRWSFDTLVFALRDHMRAVIRSFYSVIKMLGGCKGIYERDKSEHYHVGFFLCDLNAPIKKKKINKYCSEWWFLVFLQAKRLVAVVAIPAKE